MSLPFAAGQGSITESVMATTSGGGNASSSSGSGSGSWGINNVGSSSSTLNGNSSNGFPPESRRANLIKMLLNTTIDQKKLLEMIGTCMLDDSVRIVMEKLSNMENEIKNRSDSKKRKHNSNDSTENPSTDISMETPTKKRKEPPPIKNLELFTEWKTKMEEVAKMELPTLEALENLDELAESKKHIQINHKFLTQKKNNHTEQVRITYRNFFEKYPKLFYAFSYWTLNGKVKVIKEVFTHHPELLEKISEIPEKYKNFWKEEIGDEN